MVHKITQNIKNMHTIKFKKIESRFYKPDTISTITNDWVNKTARIRLNLDIKNIYTHLKTYTIFLDTKHI